MAYNRVGSAENQSVNELSPKREKSTSSRQSGLFCRTPNSKCTPISSYGGDCRTPNFVERQRQRHAKPKNKIRKRACAGIENKENSCPRRIQIAECKPQALSSTDLYYPIYFPITKDLDIETAETSGISTPGTETTGPAESSETLHKGAVRNTCLDTSYETTGTVECDQLGELEREKTTGPAKILEALHTGPFRNSSLDASEETTGTGECDQLSDLGRKKTTGPADIPETLHTDPDRNTCLPCESSVDLEALEETTRARAVATLLCMHGCGCLVSAGVTPTGQPLRYCCLACVSDSGKGRHSPSCRGIPSSAELRALEEGFWEGFWREMGEEAACDNHGSVDLQASEDQKVSAEAAASQISVQISHVTKNTCEQTLTRQIKSDQIQISRMPRAEVSEQPQNAGYVVPWNRCPICTLPLPCKAHGRELPSDLAAPPLDDPAGGAVNTEATACQISVQISHVSKSTCCERTLTRQVKSNQIQISRIPHSEVSKDTTGAGAVNPEAEEETPGDIAEEMAHCGRSHIRLSPNKPFCKWFVQLRLLNQAACKMPVKVADKGLTDRANSNVSLPQFFRPFSTESRALKIMSANNEKGLHSAPSGGEQLKYWSGCKNLIAKRIAISVFLGMVLSMVLSGLNNAAPEIHLQAKEWVPLSFLPDMIFSKRETAAPEMNLQAKEWVPSSFLPDTIFSKRETAAPEMNFQAKEWVPSSFLPDTIFSKRETALNWSPPEKVLKIESVTDRVLPKSDSVHDISTMATNSKRLRRSRHKRKHDAVLDSISPQKEPLLETILLKMNSATDTVLPKIESVGDTSTRLTEAYRLKVEWPFKVEIVLNPISSGKESVLGTILLKMKSVTDIVLPKIESVVDISTRMTEAYRLEMETVLDSIPPEKESVLGTILLRMKSVTDAVLTKMESVVDISTRLTKAKEMVLHSISPKKEPILETILLKMKAVTDTVLSKVKSVVDISTMATEAYRLEMEIVLNSISSEKESELETMLLKMNAVTDLVLPKIESVVAISTTTTEASQQRITENTVASGNETDVDTPLWIVPSCVFSTPFLAMLQWVI